MPDEADPVNVGSISLVVVIQDITDTEARVILARFVQGADLEQKVALFQGHLVIALEQKPDVPVP